MAPIKKNLRDVSRTWQLAPYPGLCIQVILGTHTLMLYSTWVWRWRIKSMGEWGNTLWFQADRFLNWKSFGLYSAFELWLISEGALHAPVCRLFCRSVPWDRHGHFAQLPSTYWALQHLVMVYSYLCPCRQFLGFLKEFKAGIQRTFDLLKGFFTRWRTIFKQTTQNWPTQILSQKWQSIPLLHKKEMSRNLRKGPENTGNETVTRILVHKIIIIFFPGGLSWRQHFKLE